MPDILGLFLCLDPWVTATTVRQQTDQQRSVLDLSAVGQQRLLPCGLAGPAACG